MTPLYSQTPDKDLPSFFDQWISDIRNTCSPSIPLLVCIYVCLKSLFAISLNTQTWNLSCRSIKVFPITALNQQRRSPQFSHSEVPPSQLNTSVTSGTTSPKINSHSYKQSFDQTVYTEDYFSLTTPDSLERQDYFKNFLRLPFNWVLYDSPCSPVRLVNTTFSFSTEFKHVWMHGLKFRLCWQNLGTFYNEAKVSSGASHVRRFGFHWRKSVFSIF